MNRIQFVELLDFDWVPRSLRTAAMAYLRFTLKVSGHADALAPKVKEALETSGQRRIVDLCSGGSGPWAMIGPGLQKSGVLDHVTLSDLRPDLGAYAIAEAAAPGLVEGTKTPTDATQVGVEQKGLRTIFNAFHHFEPATAAKVLQNAVDARAPIAIFEVTGREAMPLIGMLTAPLAVLFLTPFLRPFRLSWLFWAYLLPVLPFLIGFDGLISCLRVYSPDELRALVATLKDPGYTWDIGKLALGSAPAHATYLVGYPPRT